MTYKSRAPLCAQSAGHSGENEKLLLRAKAFDRADSGHKFSPSQGPIKRGGIIQLRVSHRPLNILITLSMTRWERAIIAYFIRVGLRGEGRITAGGWACWQRNGWHARDEFGHLRPGRAARGETEDSAGRTSRRYHTSLPFPYSDRGGDVRRGSVGEEGRSGIYFSPCYMFNISDDMRII